jgi:hypothetical protein
MTRVKWIAIGLGAAVLAVGGFALTTQGGGQNVRQIVTTTAPSPTGAVAPAVPAQPVAPAAAPAAPAAPAPAPAAPAAPAPGAGSGDESDNTGDDQAGDGKAGDGKAGDNEPDENDNGD